MYPWAKQGKKLTDYDLPRIGHLIGVGEDEIHAVLDVESRGTGFDKHGVIRLFESHVFYRQLPKEKRPAAMSMGLAHTSWSQAKAAGNYRNNYDRLCRAYDFDPKAALEATSWGLGQVMGFNHRMCGYSSALQMVEAFAESEGNQLEAMIEFIVSASLDDELRRHDWAGFARGYNGAGYKANRYDVRLRQRYDYWKRKPDTKWSPAMAAQEDKDNEDVDIAVYNATGTFAKCLIDEGDVKTFQANNGLVVDGVIGKNTWEALIR